MSSSSQVHLINPLGAALARYEDEAVAVLRGTGAQVTVSSFLEPSSAEYGRAGWVLRGLGALLRVRRTLPRDGVVVVLWPILGFLDLVVVGALFGTRGFVVVHDPVPLVRAVGYGPVSRWFARRSRRCSTIVHSEQAADELEAQGLPVASVVPHPILVDVAPPATKRAASVLVFGQFKRDRDIGLMEEIALVMPPDIPLNVVGRGWPPVAGWDVDDRFVPEDELDTLLGGAGVVLIPYRRFYQSGVAVRAIEHGTPVVGPRGSSLDVLLTDLSELLVASSAAEDWGRAIRAGVEMDRRRVLDAAHAYAASVSDSWSELFR